MECFWDTVDTIGEGFGFSLFGVRHLVTLALYIAFAALSCKRYKAADEKKRAQLRKLFAVLLLADEAFKQIGLQIGGNFNWDYLPLHLCSINIFLIALHAWKPKPAARYEFHVSDVRAGRQSARVVPRPFRLSLDRLPRAARGGVRADGRAGSAQGATGKQGDPCGGIKIKKKRFFHVEEPLFLRVFLDGRWPF